jgi:formate dehydrogenase subunit gamma
MSWRLKDSGTLISIRWIPRYDGVERVLHWSHAFAFLPLTLTGMVLFMPIFAPLAQGQAGQFIRLVHRIFAAFFILVPIFYAVFRPLRLLHTLRDLKFSRYDIDWFRAVIPYYILGRHLDMPPQGRFNTGEKLNVIVLVTGTVLFSITGLVMWFGKFLVPTDLFKAMVILHDLTMIVSVNMFIIHFYLAVAHPMMWQSLISMRFGVVSESYVREHHSAWFYGEERARKLYEEKKAASRQQSGGEKSEMSQV